MNSDERRQRRTSPRSDRRAPSGPDHHDAPAHPHVQATLLMIGIVLFLVLVAALDVR